MSGDIRVKICGLTDPVGVAASLSAGASYLGFNFFPKSPRSVTFDRAVELSRGVPSGVCKVALVVNADDAMLDALTAQVPVDMLQLHGSEPPERVVEVKARYGLPVMKAVGLAGADDVPALNAYGAVADQLLVDTKPPKGAVLPGGNGVTFDWQLVAGRRWPVPWMLAGGLTADNVAEAIRLTGTRQVDVASAVEAEPGRKDPAKIRAFCAAAGAAPVQSEAMG
ncbi:MAG: phosphoribosylanthranilate isomerase [Paracoccaceae bacterium]